MLGRQARTVFAFQARQQLNYAGAPFLFFLKERASQVLFRQAENGSRATDRASPIHHDLTAALYCCDAPPRPLHTYPSELLYYTYSISGVTYETAQDATGLEGPGCLERIVSGQSPSVNAQQAKGLSWLFSLLNSFLTKGDTRGGSRSEFMGTWSPQKKPHNCWVFRFRL